MSGNPETDPMVELDKYIDDSVFSTILRYSLFVGAIFQLLCIFATVFLPASSGSSENDGIETNEEYKPLVGAGGGGRLQKFRKQEKKKRR